MNSLLHMSQQRDFSTRFRGVIITGLEDEVMEFVRSLVSACSCLMGSLLFQNIGHGPQQSKAGKLHFGNHCHCKTSCRKVKHKKEHCAQLCFWTCLRQKSGMLARTGCFTSCRTCFLSFVTMRMVAVATWSLWVLRETHRCLQRPLWCDRGRTPPQKTPIRRFSGEHFLVFLAIHLGNSQRHCHGELTSEDLR